MVRVFLCTDASAERVKEENNSYFHYIPLKNDFRIVKSDVASLLKNLFVLVC